MMGKRRVLTEISPGWRRNTSRIKPGIATPTIGWLRFVRDGILGIFATAGSVKLTNKNSDGLKDERKAAVETFF